MKVILLNQTQTPIPRKALNEAVRHTVRWVRKNKALGPDGTVELLKRKEITLVFVSPTESKALNGKYRKKRKPTDVLSFAPSDLDSLGDLILCIDVIEKQAPRFNHSLKQEIVYMTVHGMLHLYGWDHERSKAEEKKMFAIQDQIFKIIQAQRG